MDAACRYRRRRHLSVLTSTSPGHASACSARRERHAVRAVTVDSRTARSAAHSLAYVLAVEGSKPASTQREPQDYRHTYTCRPPRLRILYACYAHWPLGRPAGAEGSGGSTQGARRAGRRCDVRRDGPIYPAPAWMGTCTHACILYRVRCTHSSAARNEGVGVHHAAAAPEARTERSLW